jgi:transcriptional regulator with XRE-family HTH domain
MLGDWIKEQRERCELSQQEVADAIGVRQSYVSRLEKNKAQRPSPEVLSRLAATFGASVEDAYQAAGLISPPVEDLQALGRPDAELQELIASWQVAPPMIRRATLAVIQSWRRMQAEIDQRQGGTQPADDVDDEEPEQRARM